ncbi:MAG TPA: CHAT domain-containing protein, partial [Thermoanaerobaculia bacterium]
MRTITLELLRHGPAHNQLLSPLTPYLALCENHGAVTVHVPCEHNQFLFRLSALDYKADEASRLFQLNDTARLMGELLATIPGLTAESNKDDDTDEPLTHLRLILSASELALLPFELAFSPNGFPGTGQYLLLQPQTPICMTRETRRVADKSFRWPERPRVLFVAASPPEVGTIPLESHLLALRRLVAPWIKYYDEADAEERRKRVEESFVFLPEASIEALEKACATDHFTHIHILAHGVKRPDGFDSRFFLAMHDARDPEKTDYISGSRLATAIRAAHLPDSEGLAQPAVVTLASCNSAG